MEGFLRWLGYTSENRHMRGITHRDRLFRAWLTALPVMALSIVSGGRDVAVAVVLALTIGVASLPVGETWTRAWILLIGYVFTLLGLVATFVFFGVHPSVWTVLAVLGLAEIVWGSSRTVPVPAHAR